MENTTTTYNATMKTRNLRYCDVTGESMREGFVIDDGMYYAKDLAALITLLTEHYGFKFGKGLKQDRRLLDQAYDNELYYWTDWE